MRGVSVGQGVEMVGVVGLFGVVGISLVMVWLVATRISLSEIQLAKNTTSKRLVYNHFKFMILDSGL